MNSSIPIGEFSMILAHVMKIKFGRPKRCLRPKERQIKWLCSHFHAGAGSSKVGAFARASGAKISRSRIRGQDLQRYDSVDDDDDPSLAAVVYHAAWCDVADNVSHELIQELMDRIDELVNPYWGIFDDFGPCHENQVWSPKKVPETERETDKVALFTLPCGCR